MGRQRHPRVEPHDAGHARERRGRGTTATPSLHPSGRAPTAALSNRSVARLLGSGPSPQPETTAIDVTGRWDVPGSGTERITLHLNQAGHHVEGWYLRRWQLGGRVQRHRLEAALVSSAADEVRFAHRRYSTVPGQPFATDGTLRAVRQAGQVHLWLHDGGVDSTLQRISTSPRLPDELIAELDDVLAGHETTPLDARDSREIDERSRALAQSIHDYFEAPNIHYRRAAATVVDAKVRALSSLEANAPQAQRSLVRRAIDARLHGWRLTIGSATMPLWDWLHAIAGQHPRWTTATAERLGGTDTGAAVVVPVNRYRWWLHVGGGKGMAFIGGSAYVGTMHIRQLEPRTWTDQFFTVLGGLHGGAAAGAELGTQVSTPSVIEAHAPWTAANFPGRYTIVGADAAVGAVHGGLGASAAFILFYGDGRYEPIGGDASGLALTLGDLGLGLSAGADIGMRVGRLFGTRAEADAAIDARQLEPVHGEAAGRAENLTSFAVASPVLSAEGRDELRRACARHLALLRAPGTTVRVDGYASPTGSRAFNDRLTELRALHTLQAMRDILGPLPSLQGAVATGHGFQPALDAGVPRGTETAAWRMTSMAIDGRVVLTLR
jgi:hypothetical protein